MRNRGGERVMFCCGGKGFGMSVSFGKQTPCWIKLDLNKSHCWCSSAIGLNTLATSCKERQCMNLRALMSDS